MNNVKISVAKNFGTRLSKVDAKNFLDLLVENLKFANRNNVLLIVDLDGPISYSDNFLENSFGSLCRLDLFNSIQILGHLKLVSDDVELIKNIQRIIGDALGWPGFFYLYMPESRQ